VISALPAAGRGKEQRCLRRAATPNGALMKEVMQHPRRTAEQASNFVQARLYLIALNDSSRQRRLLLLARETLFKHAPPQDNIDWAAEISALSS